MISKKHKKHKTVKKELMWWVKRLNCKDMREERRKCLKAILMEMFDCEDFAKSVLDNLVDD